MNTQNSRHGLSWRTAATGIIGLSLLAIAGTGVLASLNATTSNATPQTVDAGTSKLTVTATSPSAGFSSSISNLYGFFFAAVIVIIFIALRFRQESRYRRRRVQPT